MSNDELNKDPGEFYFPFSELMLHDEFIVHSSCCPEGFSSSIYLKLGKNNYKNISTCEEVTVSDQETHLLRVALAPTSFDFAYLGEKTNEY